MAAKDDGKLKAYRSDVRSGSLPGGGTVVEIDPSDWVEQIEAGELVPVKARDVPVEGAQSVVAPDVPASSGSSSRHD